MPIDPVIQAQMTDLMMRKKRLEEELAQVRVEGPKWRQRVELAQNKGLTDLASQASEKLEELRAKNRELKFELEKIDQERDVLRYQARRPSGEEVDRAERMLEEVRMGGLIDPDKASMERELNDLVSLDFDNKQDN